MNASDNATTILIHLAGGVALLIWAVRLVRTGAMRAFGVSLRQALQSFTFRHDEPMERGTGRVKVIGQSNEMSSAIFIGRGC